MRMQEITQIVQTRQWNDQHIYGICLYPDCFEIFKKVLLVALGIWLSIYIHIRVFCFERHGYGHNTKCKLGNTTNLFFC